LANPRFIYHALSRIPIATALIKKQIIFGTRLSLAMRAIMPLIRRIITPLTNVETASVSKLRVKYSTVDAVKRKTNEATETNVVFFILILLEAELLLRQILIFSFQAVSN
jgi:hypothetical protein